MVGNSAITPTTTQFEPTEDNNLRVVIDDSAVREAFLALRESVIGQSPR